MIITDQQIEDMEKEFLDFAKSHENNQKKAQELSENLKKLEGLVDKFKKEGFKLEVINLFFDSKLAQIEKDINQL